ncbi:MAG: hypothetical protein LBH06_05615 [Rikenellaceae bacterium]|jgi:hypothetical protein|nr:hypothetical protein [Rikenellaceae bacterium]
MKKLVYTIVVAAFFMLPSSSYAQDVLADSLQMNEAARQQKDDKPEISFEEKVDKVMMFIAEHTRSEEYYKLYPTTNIWTFIKLDTRSGKLWQVQFSTKGNDYRFQTSINSTDLTYGLGTKAGRFELYPTQNMYNFLLLDRTAGRLWQAQWSMDAADRAIWPIY